HKFTRSGFGVTYLSGVARPLRVVATAIPRRPCGAALREKEPTWASSGTPRSLLSRKTEQNDPRPRSKKLGSNGSRNTTRATKASGSKESAESSTNTNARTVMKKCEKDHAVPGFVGTGLVWYRNTCTPARSVEGYAGGTSFQAAP